MALTQVLYLKLFLKFPSEKVKIFQVAKILEITWLAIYICDLFYRILLVYKATSYNLSL